MFHIYYCYTKIYIILQQNILIVKSIYKKVTFSFNVNIKFFIYFQVSFVKYSEIFSYIIKIIFYNNIQNCCVCYYWTCSFICVLYIERKKNFALHDKKIIYIMRRVIVSFLFNFNIYAYHPTYNLHIGIDLLWNGFFFTGLNDRYMWPTWIFIHMKQNYSYSYMVKNI